jgi:hypothetical protein
LSHNYLSGEIPLWLQKKYMLRLDLSHNKLTGDLDGFKHQDDLDNSSVYFEYVNQSLNKNLTLSVNRLSGDLPSAFGEYADLDILRGNLFGCDEIPKNDENSDSLSCGSDQYNQSMTLMGGVLAMMASLVTVYHLFRLFSTFRIDNGKTKGEQSLMLDKSSAHRGTFLHYARYYQLDLFHRIYARHSVLFGSLLSQLLWSVFVLTTLSLLLSLPVYVLKQLDVESGSEGGETQYVTHTHMYNWLWTMAFVSGITPAIILMATSFVCLSYFNVVMNRLGGSEEPSPVPSALFLSSPKPVKDSHHHSSILTVWIVFLLNIVVVATVNGLYIWSTLLDLVSDVRVWIQLSFALFSSLWSLVLRIGLPSRIKESRYGVWLFICLNAMNTVMIPCVVTALSTPSCYQVSLLPDFSSHR